MRNLNWYFTKEDILTANTHRKRCLISFIIMEKHVKTVIIQHSTHTRMKLQGLTIPGMNRVVEPWELTQPVEGV